MNDDVDVVEEPPSGAGLALPPDRANAQPFSDPILTCRWVPAEQITKKSVITISSWTSRMTMSSACLSDDARAAAMATSLLGGSTSLPCPAIVIP